MKIVLLELVMIVSRLSAHRAQFLKPLNCGRKHNKTFFPKPYFTILCNETIVNLYYNSKATRPRFLRAIVNSAAPR